MKHLLIAAILLAVSVGGFVLTRGGSGGGDLLAERDAFFAGSFVVDFAAGPPSGRARAGTERWDAYRLTWLADGSWGFDDLREVDLPGLGLTMVHNQHGNLFAVVSGCFSAVSAAEEDNLNQMAEVPGLTYAETLLSGIDVDRDGDVVRYGTTHPSGAPGLIEEDVSRLSEGTITTTVLLQEPDEVVGTYRFTQLDGDALAEARAAIGDAAPSEQVLLQARWRPLDARGDGGPIETERPIFRDCPQLLGFGPNLDLHPLGDGTWVLEDAIAIDLPIDATRDALIGAAMDAARAGVAILAGTVIIEPVAVRVETEDGGIVYPALVIEIVSCEETDWFRCGEPAAAVERR